MINFYVLTYMVQAVVAGVDSGEPIWVTKFERPNAGVCSRLKMRPLTSMDRNYLKSFGTVTYNKRPKLEFRVVSEPKCEAR